MKHLLLCLLSAACVSGGPTLADVQADRSNWNVARNYVALQTPTQQERDAAALWLQAWDQRLQADEAAIGKAQDPKAQWAEILRVYGMALVQVELVPVLQAKAPELFRLLDKDSDGNLTQDELMGFDPTSPVGAVVVVDTAIRLLHRHR